ncbi:MAG: Rrf2 family transcriptional regulator [Endozoicomonas sp.]
MKLTKQTDYALRILIYSALQSGERLISIQEVTAAYGLSRNHVMKIVQKLGQEGFLSTLRGRGGGFRLSRSPEDIRLGDVVRSMEADLVLVECDEPVCQISPACKLRGVLEAAMSAFMEVLDQYTLADLCGNKQELSELLLLG